MVASIRFWQQLLLLSPLALFACGESAHSDEGSALNGGDSTGRKPSVILISIDSLRADHCTPYGYTPQLAPNEATTPFLKQLAEQGLLFENASAAAPWTLPSHISLFTAQSPREHGVRNGRLILPHNTPNLATKFQQAGYQTLGVYSAPFLHPAYGYGFGFDYYVPAEDYLREDGNSNIITDPKSNEMMKVHGFADSSHDNAPRVNEIALNLLDDFGAKEQPFFLFLHYWDVHYNFMPSAEMAKRFLPDHGPADVELGENFTPAHGGAPEKHYSAAQLERIKAMYDAEIRSVDDALAEIEAKLKELGIADEVIFAVVSDHGDHFGEEHEGKVHMFHHRTLYEEVMHVPFVVRAPGLVPVGQRVAGTVGLYDVGPTLMDLAGLPTWDGREGQSARSLWEQPGSDLTVHMDLFHPGEPTDSQAWRQGPFKVIWEHGFPNPKPGKQKRDPYLRAYDLAQDATESKPITELNSHTLAQKAVAKMTQLAESTPRAPLMQKMPDELIQGLKNTGYVEAIDPNQGAGTPAPPQQEANREDKDPN